MSLSDMATSSNEAREQRIMRLRQLFLHGKLVTVQSAVNYFGLTRTTIVKYCLDGDIPLVDELNESTIVAVNDRNRPSWL